MPVGAGSIKRAAKTAENGKSTEAKTAEAKAVRTKTAEAKTDEMAVQKKRMTKSAEKSGNVQKTYGIGNELPVHLL